MLWIGDAWDDQYGFGLGDPVVQTSGLPRLTKILNTLSKSSNGTPTFVNFGLFCPLFSQVLATCMRFIISDCNLLFKGIGSLCPSSLSIVSFAKCPAQVFICRDTHYLYPHPQHTLYLWDVFFISLLWFNHFKYQFSSILKFVFFDSHGIAFL